MKIDDKTLDKIRKILAKAKDPACSESEMETFMAKAQQMMTRFKLEEGDIDLHPSDIGKTVLYSELATIFKYKYKNFEWALMDMISEFNQCSIYRGFKYGWDDDKGVVTKTLKLSIIGTKENRMIVEEMYEVMSHKFLTLSNIRKKEYEVARRKEILDEFIAAGINIKGLTVKALEKEGLMTRKGTWVASYLVGCIQGVRTTFRNQKAKDLSLEADNTKYGLMVLKHKELIKLQVPTLMGKVINSNISNKSNFDRGAFQEGIKDGKSNHTNKTIQ